MPTTWQGASVYGRTLRRPVSPPPSPIGWKYRRPRPLPRNPRTRLAVLRVTHRPSTPTERSNLSDVSGRDVVGSRRLTPPHSWNGLRTFRGASAVRAVRATPQTPHSADGAHRSQPGITPRYDGEQVMNAGDAGFNNGGDVAQVDQLYKRWARPGVALWGRFGKGFTEITRSVG